MEREKIHKALRSLRKLGIVAFVDVSYRFHGKEKAEHNERVGRRLGWCYVERNTLEYPPIRIHYGTEFPEPVNRPKLVTSITKAIWEQDPTLMIISDSKAQVLEIRNACRTDYSTI